MLAESSTRRILSTALTNSTNSGTQRNWSNLRALGSSSSTSLRIPLSATITSCRIDSTSSKRPTLHRSRGARMTANQSPGGGLAGQRLRMGSASAMTDCELLQIDKKAMMLARHREHTFSDLFVAYLLARNIRYEEDLVDQLFNSSEKRLARSLLLLAHFGKEGVPETVIPKISQETLAEMIGTTRSRVSFFMNRFRMLGFVGYNGGSGLQVHSSLLNVVLHD